MKIRTLCVPLRDKIMPTKDEPLGLVDISSSAISTITNQAVNQCYGVVGMSQKNLINGIASFLSADNRRGINIHTNEDNEVGIDVYVVVEYGVPIRTVARSIQNTVKFHVEKTMGLPIHEVNVFVQGLRIQKS